ncbi:MAG: hypothetical protein HGA97_09115 [Chlorobiaceae bacterium]|nr:hypothetical protein [Chlorobiaceae bacterium]
MIQIGIEAGIVFVRFFTNQFVGALPRACPRRERFPDRSELANEVNGFTLFIETSMHLESSSQQQH